MNLRNVGSIIDQIGREGEAAFNILGKAVDVVTSPLQALVSSQTITKIYDQIVDLTNSVDQLGKTSRRLGIAPDTFAAFEYGARQAGIATDILSRALFTLEKNMDRALREPGNQQAAAFQRIGFDFEAAAKNGTALDVVLGQIADRINRLPQSVKADVSSQIFGSGFQGSGAKFLNFLALGSTGMDKLKKEAADLNITLSQDSVTNFEKLAESGKRLDSTFEFLKIHIVEGLTPAFTVLLDKLTIGTAALPQVLDRIRELSMTALGIGADGKSVPPEAQQKALDTLSQIGTATLQVVVDTFVKVGIAIVGSIYEGLLLGAKVYGPRISEVLSGMLNTVTGGILGKPDPQGVRDALVAKTQADISNKTSDLAEATKQRDSFAQIIDDPSAKAAMQMFLQKNFDAQMANFDSKAGQFSVTDQAKFRTDFAKTVPQTADQKLEALNGQIDTLRDAITKDTDLLGKMNAQIKADSDTRTQLFNQELPTQVKAISSLWGLTFQSVGQGFKGLGALIVDDLNLKMVKTASVGTNRPSNQGFMGDFLGNVVGSAQAGADTAAANDRLVSAKQFGTSARSLQAMGMPELAAIMEAAQKAGDELKKLQNDYGENGTKYIAQIKAIQGQEEARLNILAESKQALYDLAQAQDKFTQSQAENARNVALGKMTPDQALTSNTAAGADFAASLARAKEIQTFLTQNYPAQAKLIWDQMHKSIEQASNEVSDFQTKFADGWKAAQLGFQGVINDLTNTQKQMEALGKAVADTLTTGLVDALLDIADGTAKAGDAFKKFAKDAIRSISEIILKMEIANLIKDFSAGAGGGAKANSGGLIARFAGGGPVLGFRTHRDTVPAILTPGEYVNREAAVNYYGAHVFEAMNRMMVPKALLSSFGATPHVVGGAVSRLSSGGMPGATGGGVALAVIAPEGQAGRLLRGDKNSVISFLAENRQAVKAAIG